MNSRQAAVLAASRYSLVGTMALLLFNWADRATAQPQPALLPLASSTAAPSCSPPPAQDVALTVCAVSTVGPSAASLTPSFSNHPPSDQLRSDHSSISQSPSELEPVPASGQPVVQIAKEIETTPNQLLSAAQQVAQAASEPLVQPDAQPEAASPIEPLSGPLDLPADVIESSPVLQEWLQRTPDIADEIVNSPSFRTRLRLGYANFPSSGNLSGIQAGIEDVFVWPGTGLTLSGDYARSGNGTREAYGAEARFYVFPLGGYVNFAPILGYRQLSTNRYTISGVNVGMRLMIIPSRGGAADVAITQNWVAPGTQDEVGMTGASVGYAVTNRLRLSTDLQFQNSRFGQDSRIGINLEWLL